jgi:small redox-active disulfide protein 2
MTEKNVHNACAELNLAADISHVTDRKQIQDMGVWTTPAVIVDGKIVVSGRIASVPELKKMLAEASKAD